MMEPSASALASWRWAVVAPSAWPEPPRLFSYSTLRAIEACPRQWALRNALYAFGDGTRRGYPERAGCQRLVGQVLHSACEAVIRAPAPGDEEFGIAARLRALGGVSATLQRAADAALVNLSGNPRVAPGLEVLRTALQRDLPQLRPRLQGLLAGLPSWVGSMPRQSGNAPGGQRAALREGTHAEVPLISEKLSWKGTADLISIVPNGCHIVDFKTGEPKADHELQLHVYNLLWMHDRVVNPNAVAVAGLTVRYGGVERSITPLAASEPEVLARDLNRRTVLATATIAQPKPPACPSADNCGTCDVRHLCDEYWTQGVLPSVRTGRYTSDAELIVSAQTASTAHRCKVVVCDRLAQGTDVVLRASTTHHFVGQTIGAGRRIRLLDAYAQRENASSAEPDTLVVGDSTEVFAIV